MRTLTISLNNGIFDVRYRIDGKSIFAITDDIKLSIEEFYELDCEDDRLQFCEDIEGKMYTELDNFPLERIK
jgi:hypothetical protein